MAPEGVFSDTLYRRFWKSDIQYWTKFLGIFALEKLYIWYWVSIFDTGLPKTRYSKQNKIDIRYSGIWKFDTVILFIFA